MIKTTRNIIDYKLFKRHILNINYNTIFDFDSAILSYLMTTVIFHYFVVYLYNCLTHRVVGSILVPTLHTKNAKLSIQIYN